MRKIQDFKSVSIAIITSVFCLLSIGGCSANNDLSRSTAKDLILSNSQYPKEITREVLIYSYFDAFTPDTSSFDDHAKKVNQTGEATATVTKTPVKNGVRAEINVSLSENGKKFSRGNKNRGRRIFQNMVVYSVNFGEITGIVFSNEAKSAAIVEYTESYTPTPFSVFGPSYKNSEKSSNKAYFQLYDDGWRIK